MFRGFSAFFFQRLLCQEPLQLQRLRQADLELGNGEAELAQVFADLKAEQAVLRLEPKSGPRPARNLVS